ncbi:class I adenylate-forming enzyme family protein [Arthrobacter sp. AB6]|uniref:class I adenylate-forming enzyme family protein n=1 Tax=Arthrobacter sp. AB6 TaxID=2962570 RepID=UPI0028828DC7|nr:class I adenylate-forming enzyme family protein [Arthrobacter sp. AB6]MDT0196462.1 class I adenylate-forming enzyme family protein [Arthrobacter sp. AB6]
MEALAHGSFVDLLLSRTDDDAVFLIESGADGTRTEWTVQQWRNAAISGGRQLVEAGVRPGDRVGVPARNSALSLLSMFACWTAHACCVPLETEGLSPDGWNRALDSTDCRFQVHFGESLYDGSDLPASAASCPSVVLALPSATDESELSPPPVPAACGEVIGLCLYSSGTTGAPKGINLQYRNLLVNLDSMQTAFGWTPSDRVMTVLPISHGNGLIIGSLFPWYCGASVVLSERFSRQAFWEVAAKEGATVSSVVPTVLAYLDSDKDAVWAPDFREFVSGSGPLSRSLAGRVSARGPAIRQIYGLSETTCIVTMTPALPAALDFQPDPALSHLVSVGPAVPHADVAVLDRSGAPVGPGISGEVAVRGSVIMHSYHGQDPSRLESQPWFRTGDQGCWVAGPDGLPWFYITGRLKDIVIRGGLNISPVEVEDALLGHPRIDEVLVFGVPHEALGEEIGVAIVSHAGISETEVRQFAETVLEKAKRPSLITLVPSIPRTRSGKAQRQSFSQTLLAELRTSGDASEAARGTSDV